jgi:hypothetical protein
MVVDVVGASPCGQASVAFGNTRTISEVRPSALPASEVMAITGTSKRWV